MPTPQTAQLVGKYAVYDGTLWGQVIGPISRDTGGYALARGGGKSSECYWRKERVLFVGSREACQLLAPKITAAKKAERAAIKQCRAAIEDAIRSAEKEGE